MVTHALAVVALLTVGLGESVGVVESGVSDVSVRVDGLLVSSSSAHHAHPSATEGEIDESGLLIVASTAAVSVSVAVVVVLLHVLALKLGLDSLSIGRISDHGEDGSDALDELYEGKERG